MRFKNMMKSGFWVGAVIALLPANPAMAESHLTPEQLLQIKLIQEVGGSERINLSGKLRMLSQRIPAAACNLHADIAPEAATSLLTGAKQEFEKIVDGLEFGDPSLGIIGVESRRKTLAAIADLRAKYEGVATAGSHMLEPGSTDGDLQQLADGNLPLLKAAQFLVSELTGQYSDPTALLQVDSMRIDIAGRQRMLTQKMSKEACFILSGVNVEQSAAALASTIKMFDVSLTALRFGMPAAGIEAVDNPDINAGLELVAQNWAAVKPHLDALEAGGHWDAAQRAAVFEGLNTTMANMNKVVGMYSDASKLHI